MEIYRIYCARIWGARFCYWTRFIYVLCYGIFLSLLRNNCATELTLP